MQVMVRDPREPTGTSGEPSGLAIVDEDDGVGGVGGSGSGGGSCCCGGGGGGSGGSERLNAAADGVSLARPQRPLTAVLDDEVVFLYRAIRGVCTDSFGRHCAAAADVPETVIARARHVSKCRVEGRPVERIDVGSEAVEEHEKAISSLVDAFLSYDFTMRRPIDFFAANERVMDRVALGVVS